MFKKSIKILALIAFLVAAGVISIGIFANLDKIKTLTFQQEKEQDSNAQEIAQKAIDYINENMLQEGTTASLINVAEENGLYKFHLKIGEQEYDSYVTKDGKILFPDPPVDLEQTPVVQEPEQQQPEYSLETLEKLAKCLSEKGAKLYGTSGCGYCKKQKEMFGDAVSYLPYIDCSDEKTKYLCEEAEIGPVPSWDFPDKERVLGLQSLEKLAELSGCSL